MNASGRWVVLIPAGEVAITPSGAGTYAVEKRDGTTTTVMVSHVSDVTKYLRGVEYRCGIPAEPNRERAAKVGPISHTPADPHAPRLSKHRTELIAPMSVLERATTKPVEVDGMRVRVYPGNWRPWTREGVRMGRAPIYTQEFTDASR